MGASLPSGEVVGLDHVQLAAPPGCESAAREFFCTVLGLVEVAKPESLAGRGGAWFQVGRQQLHIGVEGDFAPARKAHPAFRLTSVEAVRRLAARVEALGGSVQWDDNIPEYVRFYVADPWGNRIEFLADA